MEHYLYGSSWSDSHLVTHTGSYSPSGTCIIGTTSTGERTREVALDPTSCTYQLEVAPLAADGGMQMSSTGTASPSCGLTQCQVGGIQGCPIVIGITNAASYWGSFCHQTESSNTPPPTGLVWENDPFLYETRCQRSAVPHYDVCQSNDVADLVPGTGEDETFISDDTQFDVSGGCIPSALWSPEQAWTSGWQLGSVSWSYGQPTCSQVTMTQTSVMHAADPETLECIGSNVHLSLTSTNNASAPQPPTVTWSAFADGTICALEMAYAQY